MLIGAPYIPETVTVHLGPPDSDAPNVTVDFLTYIKNVASSEIYPTWPENALRANIYVIITFLLNRIYTEWYRSRGYDFDITNSTQFDQKFVNGREIFDNINDIVDKIFTSYIVRQDDVEPLFAAFCDGKNVQCSGLSQWGTVDLAEAGYTPYEILQYYYGDDINIMQDTPVKSTLPSYPGVELKEGSFGNSVITLKTQLNRISNNYPAIPKISNLDGAYGVETIAAVKKFQEIFNLEPNGIVDEATWYKIAYIYTSVKKLAELNSEGLDYAEIKPTFQENLKFGFQGNEVKYIQYLLTVIGAYYEAISQVPMTGYFGEQTENAVKSFQRVYGLPETGIVDRNTFNDMYRAYQGIVESIPLNLNESVVIYPGVVFKEGSESPYVKTLQEYLTFIHNTYPEIPVINNTGYFGPITKQAVIAFQKLFDLDPNGIVGGLVWDKIAGVYSDLKYGTDKRPYQFPGYTIRAQATEEESNT